MRKYSQVFLTDETVCAKIAAAVEAMKPAEVLVEIGPGRGAITKYFLGKYPALCLVEIDRIMAGFLSDNFKGGYELFNADFLELELDSVFGKYGACHFAGNLPYQVSTAIIEKLLDFRKFAGAVFMFQKEVAEKLVAAPGGDAYGYLSALCAVQLETVRLFDVSRRSFSPVPKVDSSVVWIRPGPPLLKAAELPGYRKILSASFAHRRKTLLNSLSIALRSDKELVRKNIEAAGLRPEERAENLSPAEFARLAAAFRNPLENPK